MKKLLIYIIAFLIWYVNCYAGTRDPRIADQSYVNYGSKFQCIVPVCGVETSGQNFCASAVVIRPRWIVTAAHVIKNAKTCKIKTSLKNINIELIIPHEEFNSNNFGYYDIALGKIQEDIILDFYPELYTESDEIGKVCAISGYGITGTFSTGGIISDSTKRAGSNKINYIDKHLLICNLEDNPTSLEFLIASGDSGGGLFINKKLAGINSCVMTPAGKSPNSSYGAESGHTRVSLHSNWIIESINKNEKK